VYLYLKKTNEKNSDCSKTEKKREKKKEKKKEEPEAGVTQAPAPVDFCKKKERGGEECPLLYSPWKSKREI